MLKDNLEWGFAHLGKENFATKLKSDVVRFLSLPIVVSSSHIYRNSRRARTELENTSKYEAIFIRHKNTKNILNHIAKMMSGT